MIGGPDGEVVVDVDEVEDGDGGAMGGLRRSNPYFFFLHTHVSLTLIVSDRCVWSY